MTKNRIIRDFFQKKLDGRGGARGIELNRHWETVTTKKSLPGVIGVWMPGVALQCVDSHYGLESKH